ncbi:MAG: hypothetical protein ACE5JJ_04750, partial [Nitrospinota bacterium]
VLQLDVSFLIQWANFLLLLIILNYLLYRPLRTLMEGREGRIRGDLEVARRDREEAQALVDRYALAMAADRKEAAEALGAIHQELAEGGRRRLEEVRAGTARELEAARAALARDAALAERDLKGRARGLARAIARRIAGREVEVA